MSHPYDFLPEPDHVTYFPQPWLYARAIVRKKGTEGPELVLRRLRLSSSRETSTAQLIPTSACDDIKGWDAAASTLSIAEIEDEYEPTGRRMSVLRAPL